MVSRRCMGRRAAGRRDRRTLVALEQLEDRCTPSVVVMEPTYRVLTHQPTIMPHAGPGNQYGFTPAQMQAAYGFNQVTFPSGGQSVPGDGKGQTIAIVDAYDDPNITGDLAAFDSATTGFGLPAPPNFTKVGIDGQGNASTTNFPNPDPNWSVEISLDVEWAHSIAPAANILLVEANSADTQDLLSAVQYAASQPGVSVVSMSWGGPEFSGQDANDSSFSTPSGHAGVTFIASSGDNGAGVSWPAVSSHVVAAGGTTLTLDSSNNYASESGWSGSGGGVSSFTSAPSYQSGLTVYSGDPQPNGMRVVPDVAYDADPNSGVPVYVTYGNNGWMEVGGTSAASPQWAALIAIANQGRALHGQGALDGFAQTLPDLYQAPAGDFHDITTGNNGFAAGPGFDEVTGRGSPIANKLMPDLGAPMVQQVLTSVAISPANPTIGDGGQEQFTAAGLDQFGKPMVPQPSLAWQLTSGLGTIGTTSGLYTAPAAGTGSAAIQVTATESNFSVTGTTNAKYAPGPAITGLSANPAGTTAMLSATLADPNAGNLSYTWSVVSTPAGAAAPTVQPSTGTTAPGSISTTATFKQAGAYVFQLSVTDALGISASSTVSATIAQTLTSIGITPGSASVSDSGQQQFAATADDQFGNALATQPSFTWSVLVGALGTISSSGVYTAPASGTGTDTVQAAATAGSTTVTGTATVSYAAGLAITSLSANPNPVTAGTTTITAQVSDPHSPYIGYNWVVVSAPSGAAPPQFSPPSGMAPVGTLTDTSTFSTPGAYVLQLQVRDPGGQSASDNLTVNVSGTSGQGLTIDSLTAGPVSNNLVTLTAQISDSLSPYVGFNWTVVSTPAGAPDPTLSTQSGMAPVGTLTTTATFTAPGTYVIGLTVSDPNGQTANDTVSVTVNGSPPGQGLSITSLTANPNPVVGANGTLVAQIADSATAQVGGFWSVVSAPAGATLPQLSPAAGMAVDGTLSTTVTYFAPGTYQFQLQVSDSTGQSASDAVTVIVNAATPTVALTANPSTVNGTTTTLSGSVTDANQPAPGYQYVWSVVSAPSGAALPTFAAASGTALSSPIATTATFYAAGSYQFQLSITDSWGDTGSSVVSVTVVPTLTTVTLTPATVTLAQGATQQFSARALDQFNQLLSPQPSMSWRLASGPGTLTSAGLYTAPSTTGTAVVQATATVGNVTVSGTATATVISATPVIHAIGAMPNPVTATTGLLGVAASDPSGGTLTYAWSVVSKPSGAQSPVVSSPTASTTNVTYYRAGTYTFRVIVTSSVTSISTSATVTVTVAQTLARIAVSPSQVSLHHGARQQLAAFAFDQFNNHMNAKFVWTKISGPGTVSATGLYTAPGSDTGKAIIKVTATVNGVTVNGYATVTVS